MLRRMCAVGNAIFYYMFAASAIAMILEDARALMPPPYAAYVTATYFHVIIEPSTEH